MYLSNAPQTYAKGTKKRQVYYTAEARDLESLGWTRVVKGKGEKTKETPPEPAATPEPVKIEEKPAAEAPKVTAEVIYEDSLSGAQAKDLPVFDFMTKAELLQYALDRGVDLPNNALKADLVEACKKL